jgi:hypothetical protein
MWSTGDRVLAHRPPGSYWHPGTIRHIKDERFFIIYDDGEDGFVDAKQMMPLRLEPGDHVDAAPAARDDYGPARIVQQEGERYQVQFEDGETLWVPAGQVRLQPSARKQPPRMASSGGWVVGERVLACWFDLYWYPGVVLGEESGQVAVVFDHGGHAELAPDRVRLLELSEGDKVEARWRAGQEFFPGVIRRRDGDVVDIRYDDGDEETTLLQLIRLAADAWLPGPGEHELGAGDRLLARWFDGFWYPGIILAVQGKRLHVLFDDNDQADLTWDEVHPLDLEVGARVFARWQGGPFYYPGEIIKKKDERIFIQYEDGRQEWSSVRLVRVER